MTARRNELRTYCETHALIAKKSPRYSPAYEHIRKRYPWFSWTQREVKRPGGGVQLVVIFHDYPCREDGTRPSLYELLVGDGFIKPPPSSLPKQSPSIPAVRRRDTASPWRVW